MGKAKPKAKPQNSYKRLCKLFIVVDDALDRARLRREAAEQFEEHLDKMASAMNAIAEMSDNGLLDQADADSVYRMFIEAQPFVKDRSPALRLALKLAKGGDA